MYYFRRSWELAAWLGMNTLLGLLWVYARTRFHRNPLTGKPASWGVIVLAAVCLLNLVFFHLVKRQR